jgi:hypothetical protein
MKSVNEGRIREEREIRISERQVIADRRMCRCPDSLSYLRGDREDDSDFASENFSAYGVH